jgi:predicted RNase H-like nuclease (RuvC/YqgF family)
MSKERTTKPRNEHFVLVKVHVDIPANTTDHDVKFAVEQALTTGRIKKALNEKLSLTGDSASELEWWVSYYVPEWRPKLWKVRKRDEVNKQFMEDIGELEPELKTLAERIAKQEEKLKNLIVHTNAAIDRYKHWDAAANAREKDCKELEKTLERKRKLLYGR